MKRGFQVRFPARLDSLCLYVHGFCMFSLCFMGFLQKIFTHSTGVSDIMTLLYIYILFLAAGVDFISAVPHITVSALMGSTVVLPCELTNNFTQTSVIQWRTDDEDVFERSSDGTYVGEGYEGRVDIPEDELHKGNCSLVLKDVSVTDDDFYRTFVVKHVDKSNTDIEQEIYSVTLSVIGIQVSAPVGSTVVLPCEWRNLSIQTPHVEWSIDREVVFERQGKETFQGEGYEGRVDVPEDELLKGNCSLVLKNISGTDEAEYRSSTYMVKHKKTVLVQKVQLSVYGKLINLRYRV
ncbi:uncharacterized protein LOC128511523 [Clarias gariepinus]|uniref:uncharacterized protein LOC128511523 n=1 Tax=Clarias gariepinus TaxID=13013 RepID=UPI00234C7C6D|nr:uncharacterized protein LOC128511523 [Clarias gariepinus]